MTPVRLRILGALCAFLLTFGLLPVAPAQAFSGGAITAEYQRLGGGAGFLGAALGNEQCGLKGGGCFRHFQGGSIHWAPASGAHATRGAIRTLWKDLGWESGTLGYPLTGERCGLKGGGCYQHFQGGSVHWSSASGPHATGGAIRSRWSGLGWESGRLGYPTSEERCGLRGGGCYQLFQGGVVHWSSAVGAQASWGGIRSYWGRYGFENGPFGYPSAGESCPSSGYCRQSFQGGVIEWRASGGMSYQLKAGSALYAVNKRLPLSPRGFVPSGLVAVGSQYMRSDAAEAFRRMAADASAAGVGITAVSGYRSYDTQTSLYYNYVAMYGQATADTISARPGHSEHQTGLTMDIGNPNGQCGLQACFASTPAGAFAATNAWKYGFIIRYPNGWQHVTGYTYEPWHLRYVGASTAAAMRSAGAPTLEHYFRLGAAPGY